MKLAIMSDLHVDINDLFDKEIDILINYLKDNKVDQLHIAGDLANKLNLGMYLIEYIEDSGIKVTFNLGNHDMLNLNEDEIKAVSHKNYLNLDYVNLTDAVVLVGYNGWYDYNFSSISDKEELVSVKNMYWADRFINRDAFDWDIEQRERNKLKILLDKLVSKSVILATHFVPKREFVASSQNSVWNMCNGFIGSEQLGELLDSYTNISDVIFGHTHYRQKEIIFGNTRYICNPLGYVDEWDMTKEYLNKYDITIDKIKKTSAFGINHKELFEEYKFKHLEKEYEKAITVIDI